MDDFNKNDNFNEKNDNDELKQDNSTQNSFTDDSEKEHTQDDNTGEGTYGSGYTQQSNQYSNQNQQSAGSYSNPYSYNQQGKQYYYQNGSPYYTNPQVNNTPKKSPKNKRGIKVLSVIVAIIVVISAITIGYKVLKNDVTNPNLSEKVTTGDNTALKVDDTPLATPSVTGDVLSTTEIAEIARKSSVGVLVYSTQSSYYNSNGSDEKKGEGTGIVMSLDATKTYTYVITCAHVISDANIKVKILLEDGTTYDAEIVGFDRRTDVGVLKIKTNKLTPATFGNSDSLKVGENVYAVGNPGGSEFFGSFTDGLVSAIGRSINNEIGYTMECIQHNAAINPGNSGGALYNSYGQVIGINSSKIASAEFEGMSFSIPIASAKPIIDNLIKHGYVPNRPKLGISYSSVSAYQTYSMVVQIKGLPLGSLIVREINADSDLKGKDIEVGDLITHVNGKALDKADTLFDTISKGKVGESLTLRICRINKDYSVKEFDVSVKLVEDTGTVQEEETTMNIYDYFNQFGQNEQGN